MSSIADNVSTAMGAGGAFRIDGDEIQFDWETTCGAGACAEEADAIPQDLALYGRRAISGCC
jgi:hypothetical protein